MDNKIDNIKDLLLHAAYLRMLGHTIEEQAKQLCSLGYAVTITPKDAE